MSTEYLPISLVLGSLGVGWFALAYLEGKIFCQHKFTCVSSFTTESNMEQSKRLWNECPRPRDPFQFEEMTKKKLIETFCCSECGKLVRYINNI